MKNAHPDQMDLFEWAEIRPTSVIDARDRFEAKVEAMVMRMIATNQLPPHLGGKVIKLARSAA